MQHEGLFKIRLGVSLWVVGGLMLVAACKGPESSKLKAWGGDPEFYVTSTESDTGFALAGTEEAPALEELTKLELASAEPVQVDALSDSGLTPLASADGPEMNVEFTVDGGRACRVSFSQVGKRHPVQCEESDTAEDDSQPANGTGEESSSVAEFEATCQALYDEGVADWVGSTICQCGGSMVRYDRHDTVQDFEDACRGKAR